ncbi:MAG: hypothetical protein R3C15_07165 [Thermoleophilia bacterium]
MRRVILVLAVLVAAIAAGTGSAGAATGGPTSALAPSGFFDSLWFQSPTGNIRCRFFPNRRLMACTTLNDGFTVGVPLYGAAWKRRFAAPLSFPGGPTLEYGESYTGVGPRGGKWFTCTSRSDGMRCRSAKTKRGFFLNATSYGLF